MTAEQKAELKAWDSGNANGRMLISQSVSQKVLGKLAGLRLASAMWKKLDQLYLKKSPENLFTLQGKFFDYKMSATDDIASHIQNVNEMAAVLADLGNAMSKVTIMSKIICSLPPSYNNVTTAWSNVHPDEQTVDTLEDLLTRYEEMVKRQGTRSEADQAFFARSQQSWKPLTKKKQHTKDIEYLKNIKARTKCYNCKEIGH